MTGGEGAFGDRWREALVGSERSVLGISSELVVGDDLVEGAFEF